MDGNNGKDQLMEYTNENMEVNQIREVMQESKAMINTLVGTRPKDSTVSGGSAITAYVLQYASGATSTLKFTGP